MTKTVKLGTSREEVRERLETVEKLISCREEELKLLKELHLLLFQKLVKLSTESNGQVTPTKACLPKPEDKLRPQPPSPLSTKSPDLSPALVDPKWVPRRGSQAEQVLLYLDKHGDSKLRTIDQQLNIQNPSLMLSRICYQAGTVRRVSFGIYGLTQRGREAVQIIKNRGADNA